MSKLFFMSTNPNFPFELLMKLPTSTFELTVIIKFEDMESMIAFLSVLDLNIVSGIKVRHILNSECTLVFLPALDLSKLEISYDDTDILQVSNLISSCDEMLT